MTPFVTIPLFVLDVSSCQEAVAGCYGALVPGDCAARASAAAARPAASI